MKLRSGRVIKDEEPSPSKGSKIDVDILSTWVTYKGRKMNVDKVDMDDVYAEYKLCTRLERDIVDSVIRTVKQWQISHSSAVSCDITETVTNVLGATRLVIVPWDILSKYLLRECNMWICTVVVNDDGSFGNIDVYNFANQTFDHFMIECCLDDFIQVNHGQPMSVTKHFAFGKSFRIMVTTPYYNPISQKYELWAPDQVIG
jgi:hypothetical protein